MSYRVVQWGTGSVGTHALRTIIERPDYDLAGVRVYNPDKVGVDAGTLVGGHETGVLATDSRDEILALDADVVCYTPLGGTLGNADDALDDVCALLASGKNVVCSAVEQWAYLTDDRDVSGAGRDAYKRLRSACDEGGTSLLEGGINPGYGFEVWPLTLSQLSRRIDRLTCTEVVDMSRYSSSHMLSVIGFGVGHDESHMDAHFRANILESPYALAMRTVADAVAMPLDDIIYTWDTAAAEVTFDVAGATIAEGTTAAIKYGLQGIVAGEPRLVFDFVWRVSNDVAPDWPIGDSVWIAQIEGDPTITSQLDISTTMGSGRAVSLTVATVLLNAVPKLVAAEPGLYNKVGIGFHAGGYFGLVAQGAT